MTREEKMSLYAISLRRGGVDLGYVNFTKHGYVGLHFNTGEELYLTRPGARILARRLDEALDAWARCRPNRGKRKGR
jgi:hypothetical protein